MNHNKNVVIFTLVTTFIMLLYSVASAIFDINPLHINNISIVSDVMINKKTSPVTISDTSSEAIAYGSSDSNSSSHPEIQIVAGGHNGHMGHIKPENLDSLKTYPDRTLADYNLPKHITTFNTDTSKPSLPVVMHKLYELKQTRTGKVRIAWLGDSMIEGDLLTQTVRKMLQEYFGGAGVGFVPATSIVANFRGTVRHKWKGEWDEENFKTSDCSAPLFFSGHTFFTKNGELIMKDVTLHDTIQLLEKNLICGKVDKDVKLLVNGHDEQFKTEKNMNRLLMDYSESHAIDVTVQNDKLPVYGVSFESKDGVVVDNFSFRGITGLELNKLDTMLLANIDSDRTYDLVVLEYGTNLLFRPDDTDYSWYEKHIIPVVRKLQRLMPHTEFLIISSGDRAFRYGDTWQSAVGIKNLVRSQAVMAYVNNAPFYNMFASMGGTGSIVSWAESSPPFANKDYIHPNQRGAEKLGNIFFEAFMKDYYKANRKAGGIN